MVYKEVMFLLLMAGIMYSGIVPQNIHKGGMNAPVPEECKLNLMYNIKIPLLFFLCDKSMENGFIFNLTVPGIQYKFLKNKVLFYYITL